ncbi:hypothetical protein ACNOYE_30960 [Nannocystaceae bacterium ST9]
MSLELPEQRQRALAGLGTLLRIRVLDPMAAVWTAELRTYVDDLWFEAATVQRRQRQDLQVALEGYSARAVMVPPDLGAGRALLDVRARIDTLTTSINATIDRLIGVSREHPTSQAAALTNAAAQLDRSVVALHRWFVDLQLFDDSAQVHAGPSEPSVPSQPSEPSVPSEPAQPSEPAEPSQPWSKSSSAARARADWWRPARAGARVSPWTKSIHGSPTPTSLNEPDPAATRDDP